MFIEKYELNKAGRHGRPVPTGLAGTPAWLARLTQVSMVSSYNLYQLAAQGYRDVTRILRCWPSHPASSSALIGLGGRSNRRQDTEVNEEGEDSFEKVAGPEDSVFYEGQEEVDDYGDHENDLGDFLSEKCELNKAVF